jgi:hypothetical protein
MESNICLGCRFGSVKIEVSVPQNLGLKDFAEQTKVFAAELTEFTKSKPIHYSLKFDAPPDCEELDFSVNCQCILNVNKLDCSKFNSSQNCRVKHLHPNSLTKRGAELAIIRTV